MQQEPYSKIKLERREYTRIATSVAAELVIKNQPPLTGTIYDISLGGAHIDLSQHSYTALKTMLAPSKKAQLHCGCSINQIDYPASLSCVVVEVIRHRIGLRFIGANRMSYVALKQFLLANAEHRDQLIDELKNYPNWGFAGAEITDGIMQLLKHLPWRWSSKSK